MKHANDDIAELEKRIKRFKKKREISRAKTEISSSTGRHLANAFRIGTEFIGAVFVGLCIGYVLDDIFGTKVIFILVFSLFGCIAGILNVYRSAQQMDADIQKEND